MTRLILDSLHEPLQLGGKGVLERIGTIDKTAYENEKACVINFGLVYGPRLELPVTRYIPINRSSMTTTTEMVITDTPTKFGTDFVPFQREELFVGIFQDLQRQEAERRCTLWLEQVCADCWDVDGNLWEYLFPYDIEVEQKDFLSLILKHYTDVEVSEMHKLFKKTYKILIIVCVARHSFTDRKKQCSPYVNLFIKVFLCNELQRLLPECITEFEWIVEQRSPAHEDTILSVYFMLVASMATMKQSLVLLQQRAFSVDEAVQIEIEINNLGDIIKDLHSTVKLSWRPSWGKYPPSVHYSEETGQEARDFGLFSKWLKLTQCPSPASLSRQLARETFKAHPRGACNLRLIGHVEMRHIYESLQLLWRKEF